MKRVINLSFFTAHLLLAATVVLVLLPGKKSVQPNTALMAGIGVMELLYLWRLRSSAKKGISATARSHIMIILWAFLLLWELLVTKLNLMHPVLVPAPENVFYVFQTQYAALLLHILASLELLLISIAIGLFLGVLLGVITGWFPGLRDVFTPIANVLAPIPSVIYAPYIIAVMPTFRSASAMVIVLGIFLPTFLSMISRVESIDVQILDSARMLNVGSWAMITKILLPYILPGVVSGLKVTLTTAFMLLMFAEMMGATRGLGYYIVNYHTYGNYTNVIACIIVIGILVTILSRLVSFLQRKAIKWR